jgi:hypothetical protein
MNTEANPGAETTVRSLAALEIIACPECGLPAEISDWGTVSSTAGRVEIVRITCVQRHWFITSSDRRSGPAEPRPSKAP